MVFDKIMGVGSNFLNARFLIKSNSLKINATNNQKFFTKFNFYPFDKM